MSSKTLRDIGIVMVIVFALTVIVYPLIFGPDREPKNGPPVELDLGK